VRHTLAVRAGMSDLLRSTLGEHIRIETVFAAGLWRTSVDPHQLENVILNIAINARDAMREGGKLTIETANL
jgi:signal transduction histidine kinase